MNALEAVNIPVVHELNTGNNTGVKQGTGNLDSNYRRSSSYDSFLAQAKSRMNLDVLHYAPVQGLRFNNDTVPKVTGVSFRDEPTSLYHQVTAKKEVIVSMGAFHTPQLLMVSGIGPEEQLSRFGIGPVHINENVGQHLNDHSVFSIMAKASPDAGSASTRDNNVTNLIAAQELFYSQNTGTYTPPVGITNGFQQLSNQTLTEIGAQAVIDLGYTNRSHVEFLFENIFCPGGPTPYYIPKFNESYIAVTTSSLVALSRGNVTLRGAGMADLPVINPNYYADPTDRAIAIHAFSDLRKILAHPALAQYTVGPNNGEVSPGIGNVADDEEDKRFEVSFFPDRGHSCCLSTGGPVSCNQPRPGASSSCMLPLSDKALLSTSKPPPFPPGTRVGRRRCCLRKTEVSQPVSQPHQPSAHPPTYPIHHIPLPLLRSQT